jgi:Lrp/AsnC family leucine-responsive transcriptional regulator
MNRSRYVTRHIDVTDRAIIAALNENGRLKLCELAEQVGLSSPSVTERIHKLHDAGAIRNYTIAIDPTVFGLGITAHVRMRARPGEVTRLAQMLVDTPEIVEAERVTGEDCFVAKVIVADVAELAKVIDPFLPFSSTDTAIVQSVTVPRRLPKLNGSRHI